ncbi:MAG: type III-A CRISPR-associated protein Cas10/Csm1 [Firmicutes bacterium]|nr:type III-A CRISPR-associated protein Cas10/Csm1 [Bacillota bacterium]
MTNEHAQLITGALLHDIGKIIYRTGVRKDHSTVGYEFLRNDIRLDPAKFKGILDAVRYHHGSYLKNANIPDDSPAYITYIADNIASAADRRKNEEPEYGFERLTPLESIFNRLNGNDQKYYYRPGMLGGREPINYPEKDKQLYTDAQYAAIVKRVKDAVASGIDLEDKPEKYINSLIEVLESTLTYVPSSTSKSEAADISLYDHVKITAAAASCIYFYLKEKGENDHRSALFKNAEKFYSENAFIMYSMDISGIQKFIYTIRSKGALRTLRARSFYLEIFMENMIDELFDRLELSRANLIYCGGGHMYALLPNTENVKKILDKFEREINLWLLKTFKTSLFVATGYSVCSAHALENKPEGSGSYKAVYREVSRRISEKKMRRYNAADIKYLNSGGAGKDGRECSICKAVDHLNEENICDMCASITNMSKGIQKDSFFSVISEHEQGSVPLMDGRWMISESEEELKSRMKNKKSSFVRAFAKNAFYTGMNIPAKLWVGDYASPKVLSELSDEAAGIDRVAALRMDVDNLGQAFVAGFENKKNGDKYVTLSRTATFSRQMTIFFKYHINRILSASEHTFIGSGMRGEPRNVSIVYSGGDDVFLIGAWNDVVEAAIDIRNDFIRYTQGTLTISGGIGMYKAKFPIHIMASETGGLEDISKKGDKDALTIFYDEGCYRWNEFENIVLGEKFDLVRNFMTDSDERGKNFLYNLLELIRNRKEKINIARFVYMLSRLEPVKDAPPKAKESYRNFADTMFDWIRSDEDSRQLITAIYLYVYLIRGEEEK